MKSQQSDTTQTSPFAITFDPFHYAVWQCRNKEHAAQRAADTYPNKKVVSIEAVK